MEVYHQMEIKHEHRVFYVGKHADEALAKMTYYVAGESSIIADHAEVSDVLRGQGVGQKLLEHLVKFVREHYYTIIPLCPFVKVEMNKNPEKYKDVRRSFHTQMNILQYL